MNGPVPNPEIRLTAIEYDACWELLGLGERPPALALPSPGRTYTERRRILAEVHERLRRRGLTRADRPHEGIAELLGLLARPAHEIDLHLSGGRAALAAVRADSGVVATRVGDDVHTVGVRAAEVVPRLVGLVGPITPAAVRPVNIPADALDQALKAAGPTLWAVADELAARSVPKVDAAALARAFGRVHQVGQFSVTVSVDGRRRRGPWAIGVHRADTGWVGTIRRPAESGATGAAGATLSVFPLTAERLAGRLTELVRRTGAVQVRRTQHPPVIGASGPLMVG